MLNTKQNRLFALKSYVEKMNTLSLGVCLSSGYENDLLEQSKSNSVQTQSNLINNTFAVIPMSGNVIYGFTRNDWNKGNTYDYYNLTNDTSNKRYVILTPERKVYVCLWNNEGKQSDVMPNHTTYNIKTYPDGYKWLYVYTLSADEITKQLTDTFVPFNFTNNSVKTFIDEHTKNSLNGQVYYIITNGTIGNQIQTVTNTGNGVSYSKVLDTLEIVNNGKNYSVGDYVLDGNKQYELLVTPMNGFHSDLLDLLNVHYANIHILLKKPLDYEKMFVSNVSLITKSTNQIETNLIKIPYINNANLTNGLQIGDTLKIINKSNNSVCYSKVALFDDGYFGIGLNPTLNVDLDNLDVYVLSDDTEIPLDKDLNKSIIKSPISDNLNKYNLLFSTNANLILDDKKECIINFLMDF